VPLTDAERIDALEAENKALRKANALARKHWTDALTQVEKMGQKRHFLGRMLKRAEDENQELRAQLDARVRK
jgi:hypothetical protein